MKVTKRGNTNKSLRNVVSLRFLKRRTTVISAGPRLRDKTSSRQSQGLSVCAQYSTHWPDEMLLDLWGIGHWPPQCLTLRSQLSEEVRQRPPRVLLINPEDLYYLSAQLPARIVQSKIPKGTAGRSKVLPKKEEYLTGQSCLHSQELLTAPWHLPRFRGQNLVVRKIELLD